MSIEWLDDVTLTCEVALSSSTGPYFLFGSGRFGIDAFGPAADFADVSADLRGLSTSRAFSREVQAWDPGTATVRLNNRHRYYSPSNLDPSNPYVTAGVSQVQPLRDVRLRATYNGVTYPLYYGYVGDWLETFAGGHADFYVTLPCEDAMAALAAVDGYERTPVGAGEDTGARIHRILNAAGYTGPRNIEAGQVTVQATTLAANAATELKLTTDSEGGGLWIDADGTLCFEREYALIENDRSNTVQAIFGDGSGSELPCIDVTPSNSADLVKNEAAFARVGSTEQIARDNESVGKYRLRRESRTDLICETDAQALGLAEFFVARHKDPEYRIKQVKVCPRDDPARLYPVVFGLRPRDLVQVVVRPTDTETITSDCHIAGIHHDTDGDNWITTFDLWSASIYTQYSESRFGIGRFGTTMRFFFGTG